MKEEEEKKKNATQIISIVYLRFKIWNYTQNHNYVIIN